MDFTLREMAERASWNSLFHEYHNILFYECTQIKVHIKHFWIIYNTYMYDKNRQSYLSLFRTDEKKKARWSRSPTPGG